MGIVKAGEHQWPKRKVLRLRRQYKLAAISTSGIGLLARSKKRWQQGNRRRDKIALKAAAPLMHLLNKVGAASVGRLGAAVIGRPALAREIAAKEKDSALRKNLLIWGDLPFVTAEEVKSIPGFDKLPDRAGIEKNLRKLQGFRCFSKQEIAAMRGVFKQIIHAKGVELPKGFTQAQVAITDMIGIKYQIMEHAVKEPQLTSIMFNEVVPLIGLNNTTRASAIALIQHLMHLQEGKSYAVAGETKEGEKISLSFTREKGIEWTFRKIQVNEKKKR